jgi:tyrosyl-tRNA synthetase
MIGDPSDKDKLSPALSEGKVMENARTYAEQAFRILDPERTQVLYNDQWLRKLSMTD